MAGLQRSAVSFRRQGSSGLVWDDKILLGELNNDQKPPDNNNLEQQDNNPENKTQNDNKEKEANNNNKDSHSSATAANNAVQSSSDGGGGRGYRTGKVSPAIEPPSPRISACGFCGAFGKENKSRRNRFSNGKRISRSR